MNDYCTQNNGDCTTCSLVNYNRDCQNNPITIKDDYIHIRINRDLKRQAQEYAKQTGRTLAGLIEYLLRQELKKGEKEMNTWIVLDYKNGNKSIMSKTQYEKEVGSLNDYDEAVAGIVESEKQPTWLDLEFDEETKQYYLK